MNSNNSSSSNGNGQNGALHAALPISELIRIGRETPDLAKAQEYASAIARTIKNDPYDPGKHPDDRLKEEKFQKDCENLKDFETATAHALTNVKDGERKASTSSSTRHMSPFAPSVIRSLPRLNKRRSRSRLRPIWKNAKKNARSRPSVRKKSVGSKNLKETGAWAWCEVINHEHSNLVLDIQCQSDGLWAGNLALPQSPSTTNPCCRPR